jgi:hypothetical protein
MSEQTQLPLSTEEISYYQQRMALLGVKPEYNVINLWKTETDKDSPNFGENVLKPFPIFRESGRGIDILVYSLGQINIKTHKDGQRSGVKVKLVDKDYCITRLEKPIEKANGDIIKYLKPSGEPSYPFFPPKLVAKFAEKKKIPALYITEGFFKSFKADMHGIDCVGLQSITCLRDKETNQIWDDILQLIATCQVERVIWLTDGDFMNITSKELTDGIDLYKRPNVFYNSAYTFYEITSQLTSVERYFAHINTDDLAQDKKQGPKGLDDLLCDYAEAIPAIAMEFSNFAVMAPGKVYPGTYITRMNITIGVGRVRQYILKEDVTKFYLFHSERRPELKDIGTFKFNGTVYRYNEKEGKCDIEMPGEANDYIRAGNDYYKHITYPDGDGRPVKSLEGRAKGTIMDDHGKDFCKHIKKYEKFCIVPNHFNFQPIIHNCYNMYNPFIHEPEEGDCSNTIAFFKHIFSEELVPYKDAATGVETTIPRYQLGLDYITLAYKFPQQMLPILCLVSRERQTGKTTFINYIDALFVNNAISIGNEDIEADFNAHWAGKLFIMVDETKVDNGKVINKIKRLSTAREIILNAKGKDQTKLPFFAKFILNSNHVEDFIRIDKEENRFWIQKVKPLTSLQPRMLQTLIDEIPAFIHYLNTRQMVSKEEERHWFSEQLLQTEALTVVKDNSVSGMEKKIKTHLAYLFEMSNMERIRMPLKDIAGAIRNAEKDYVKKTLNDMGYKTASGQYKYPREKEENGGEVGAPVQIVQSFTMVTGNTTYYEFLRADFTQAPVIDPMASTEKSATDTNEIPF